MTSRPPKCSASVTTPSGIDIHALMRGDGFCSSGSRSIRTSSVEPPPMSNRMAPRPCGSSSGEQPITASAASVSRSITSSRMPVSAATRSRKPSAFDAARQASVAISRSRLAFLDWILSRQMLKRGDGALDRRVADAAGRRDALAQPDDPRERIHHAEPVVGRAGDQQAAIIGAEVERGVDAGTRCQPRFSGIACGDRYDRASRATSGHREAACHPSSKCLFAADHGRRGISFRKKL